MSVSTLESLKEQIAEGGASLESNWDLSLSRLADESPAAYRLLELCSVLAPEIAIDLLTSNGFGQLVRQLQSQISGQIERTTETFTPGPNGFRFYHTHVRAGADHTC